MSRRAWAWTLAVVFSALLGGCGGMESSAPTTDASTDIDAPVFLDVSEPSVCSFADASVGIADSCPNTGVWSPVCLGESCRGSIPSELTVSYPSLYAELTLCTSDLSAPLALRFTADSQEGTACQGDPGCQSDFGHCTQIWPGGTECLPLTPTSSETTVVFIISDPSPNWAVRFGSFRVVSSCPTTSDAGAVTGPDGASNAGAGGASAIGGAGGAAGGG